jgi:hypothetical protein
MTKTLAQKSGQQRPSTTPAIGIALLTAAMALPTARTAQADLPPERGQMSLKYLEYDDYQPGEDRIRVHTPSINLTLPIAGVWSFSGTFTSDVVTGASPAYHTEQLTEMHEHRKAVDLSVTRYFPRGTLTLGVSNSVESDYTSNSFSAQGTVSTESKNTTFNFGVGVTSDTIQPEYWKEIGIPAEPKNVTDFLAGVTQVLTRQDIAQINLGYSYGRGYFSDPYKWFDERPRRREHATLLARWNHHFDATDGTSHMSYRYYQDNWEVKSSTLDLDYLQPLGNGWRVTPNLRFYTQSSAYFYLPVDPAVAPGPTFPSISDTYYSEDQRLSAFGAITYGLKLEKELTPDLLMNVQFEHYEQRENWSLSGKGDPGLANFNANFLMFGITRYF